MTTHRRTDLQNIEDATDDGSCSLCHQPDAACECEAAGRCPSCNEYWEHCGCHHDLTPLKSVLDDGD